MNGHVFQCNRENTDKQQFMKTVVVLEEHVNKTYSAALGAEGPYQSSVKEQVLAETSGSTLSTAEFHSKAITLAKKKSTAIAFLKQAGRKRYGGLWSDLEIQFTPRQDHYPTI
jgi:hypothetical protein